MWSVMAIFFPANGLETLNSRSIADITGIKFLTHSILSRPLAGLISLTIESIRLMPPKKFSTRILTVCPSTMQVLYLTREVRAMELWFSELHTPNVKFSIKVDRQLFSATSEFQRIDIFESKDFGRFLILDGCMMLTEKDEFIYHEMIAHVPMCVNPSIKKVLLIGGGDGGSARELLKYSTVERIDLVEIDELVIEACRKFLPQTAGCLDDPRVSIKIEDGLKFVRRCVDEYDLIIVDSTDPFGPGEGLFTKEFYGNCFKDNGQSARESVLHEGRDSDAARAQADRVVVSDQSGISAAHSDVSIGALAVRVCVEGAASDSGRGF